MDKNLNYFQSFVDNNNIESIKDWYERSKVNKRMKEYLCKCSKLNLLDDLKFIKNYPLFDNTIQSIQDFIHNNYITDLSNLNSRFNKIYSIVIMNKWRATLKFCNCYGVDYSWVNTLDDFKEFIESTKFNTRNKLRINARTIYNKSIELGWMDIIIPPTQKKPTKWSSFLKTQEDVNKFFIENNILDKDDMNSRFGNLGYYLGKHNLKTNYTKEKPFDWSHIISNNKESEKFFRNNNIINQEDANVRFPGLLYYLYKNKIQTYFLKYINKLDVLSLVKNEIKLKQFFIDNNIKNTKILHRNFNYLESIMYKMGISTRGFCLGTSGFDSSWEEIVFNKLSLLPEFYNLEHNKDLGCKDKGKMPFDIVFNYKDLRYIIEILGPSHFFMNRYGKEHYIKTRKHDIMKNKWSKENEYNLYYLTIEEGIQLLNKYKFPYYVYTKLEDIINDIKLN